MTKSCSNCLHQEVCVINCDLSAEVEDIIMMDTINAMVRIGLTVKTTSDLERGAKETMRQWAASECCEYKFYENCEIPEEKSNEKQR